MLTRLLVPFFCLGLVLAGCDSGDGNTGTNDVAGNSDVADSAEEPDLGSGDSVDDDSGQTVEQCEGLPNLTGQAFRVTKLVGKKPTDLVNTTWAEDIAAYDLVLLMRVVEHDAPSGKVTMSMTSAKATLKDDGNGNMVPDYYKYALEPAQFEVQMKGCKFYIQDPIELRIMTPTVSKPFRVFNVKGQGEFSNDGQKVPLVSLKGAILETESTDLCVLVPGFGTANFHWFMNAGHICPDLDSDGDSVIDAYAFEGVLAAVNETSLYQEGIDPMVSLIDKCDPNTEPCTE